MDILNFTCPKTKKSLVLNENNLMAGDVCYPIKDSIPRFVESDNYAGSIWIAMEYISAYPV